MERVIITGATGYIGYNLLIKLIDLGWSVAIIKRRNSDISKIKDYNIEMFDYDGTIDSLKEAFHKFKPEGIFHLASEMVIKHNEEDVDRLINSNLLFGTLVLEAMNSCGIKKFINTSTFWQTPEGKEYNPYTLYTSLKQAFEDILKFYANDNHIKSISLRLPDIYGPDDNRAKILNLVKQAAITGNRLEMTLGEQEMDLLYIEDVVQGFIRAYELLDHTENDFKVYSLSSLNPSRLRKTVEIFEKVNNIPLNIEWGAIPYRENQIMKISLPKNVLPKWESKVSLDEGLKKFMNN
jgi:nucleoside-diphosphate-sugar epimerase